MHTGTIIRVVEDRAFGFIGSPDQPDVFFHKSDLVDGLDFNAALLELRVRFDIIGTPKGPRAANVRPAD